GGERQDLHVHASRAREGLEELVVRGLVQRRVDRDRPRRLWRRGGRRRSARGRRRGCGRASARGHDGGGSGQLQERATIELWRHSTRSEERRVGKEGRSRGSAEE